MTEHTLVRATRESGSPVSALVRATAAAMPDGVALKSGERVWTYDELSRAVGAAGVALRDAGVGRGDLVALCTVRRPELAIALLATFELGAVAMPVQDGLGAARMADAIGGGDVRAVVADAEHREVLQDALAIEELASPGLETSTTRQKAEQHPLACVLHTSGSTGVPKPVMLTHDGLANRLTWGQRTYPLGRGDVVLHQAAPVFDFALWELLAPLCFGATVAVAPAGMEGEPGALAAFLRQNEVTCAHFVPSLLAEFLGETCGAGLADLRYLFCGGEPLPAALVDQVRASTEATLFNQYGPAEATIDCVAWQVPPRWSGAAVPIGTPISGTTAYVLDGVLEPVLDREAGVLHVGGRGLAWGYRGDPRATAAAFLPDPYAATPGSRMYRTGDLAKQADGVLEFLGRADDQIKIRGVRVEPAAVEQVLSRHPGVAQAAVVPVTRAGRPGLAAHYVSAGPAGRAAGLRAFLSRNLPSAAVPAEITAHETLPRLPTGKVDRPALSRLSAAEAEPLPSQRPASATEAKLAEIWKTLLQVEEIGPQEDFFEAGGHSLLAMRLMARMRAAFGVRLPARAIFDFPTVEALARLIDQAHPGAAS